MVSIIKTKRNATRLLDLKKILATFRQGRHIVHMRIIYVRVITLTIQTSNALVLLQKQEHNDAVLNEKFGKAGRSGSHDPKLRSCILGKWTQHFAN